MCLVVGMRDKKSRDCVDKSDACLQRLAELFPIENVDNAPKLILTINLGIFFKL